MIEDSMQTPIPMILHCPNCGVQHIDEGEWVNIQHRSHECQTCGNIWRVADVATVGVLELKTKGKLDTVWDQKSPPVAYAAEILETGELFDVASFNKEEVRRHIDLRNIVLGKTYLVGPVGLYKKINNKWKFK